MLLTATLPRAAGVAPEVQAQFIGQSADFTNLKIPDEVNGERQAIIRQAIQASFINGFRLVAYLAAGLALASALASWLLIAGKAPPEKIVDNDEFKSDKNA
jgi:hypothetical protein